MFKIVIRVLCVFSLICISSTDIVYRQCELIRIDMCRGIGYNETSMPNLVGHELQSDVEFTLQTFAPLIDTVCSTQLKLFLCAAYVPMCTPKVPVPIGPCRSLCESVRFGCNPLLQGFGFPWPPVLDCNRFPKENNQETMCMEGPGEELIPFEKNEDYSGYGTNSRNGYTGDCPGVGKPRFYVKIHRYGRCAHFCDAPVLFSEYDKHSCEIWAEVWCYSSLSLALVTIFSLALSDNSKHRVQWSKVLLPMIWCHAMVTAGWNIRFLSGRTAAGCGYDPQLPNVSLLLIDGLSNMSCAATFILRYYFGMAACAWWAILCLAWHRELRSNCPELNDQIKMSNLTGNLADSSKRSVAPQKGSSDVFQSNFSRFLAWGLPAFQTVAVIIARLVDADELLGACYVGNQSDKGLQALVATPLFCYWIFGSMNLISGYLVRRRSKEILGNANQLQANLNVQKSNRNNSNLNIGIFLITYCIPFTILLLAVIYEFANIDIWLNTPASFGKGDAFNTPLWPFLTRVFSEVLLGIICFAWILGPKISIMYKRHCAPQPAAKLTTVTSQHSSTCHSSNVAYSTVSYQTICFPPNSQQAGDNSVYKATCIPMTHFPHNSKRKHRSLSQAYNHERRRKHYNKPQNLYRDGNEIIL